MKKSWILIKCYLFIFLVLIACLIMFGCTTQYVPVETIRTEIVHQHDTIKQTDSVKNEIKTIIRESRPEDSAMIADLGIKLQANERLLILMQKELHEYKNEKYESHNNDSVREKEVQVPYPVERKLSKWEQFKMDCGGFLLGVIIVFFATLCIKVYLARRETSR